MGADITILGDLGGTHLRLALLGAKGPENLRDYVIRDWPGLSEVLKDYRADLAGARLLLSFAKKYNPDGVYRFDKAYKDVAWEFSIADLKKIHGLRDVQVVHDFRAMALALFHGNTGIFEQMVQGLPSQRLRAVIGVGTGLGHALADPETKRVYDTFGGHFPPCAVTPEQKDMLVKLEAGFGGGRTYIFEEVLSGRGLEAMYRICGGTEKDITTANDAAMKTACRLFCEFLGLYANVVCVAAHAFGGVYLTGGVLEKLETSGRFDWDAFKKYFRQDMVAIVDEALGQTPVFRAESGHTALYGLEVYAQSLSDH